MRTRARSQNGDLLKLTFLASHQCSNEISISNMILLIYFHCNESDMIGGLLRYNLIQMRRRNKSINKFLIPSFRPQMGDVWLVVWTEILGLKSIVATRISYRRRVYISP